ncbi:MAG: hypothetical protein AB7M12_01800 [Hyphomonadaceae bacterium]
MRQDQTGNDLRLVYSPPARSLTARKQKDRAADPVALGLVMLMEGKVQINADFRWPMIKHRLAASHCPAIQFAKWHLVVCLVEASTASTE